MIKYIVWDLFGGGCNHIEENFRTNLLRVMCHIENHNNYKKWDKYKGWEYTIEDFNKSLNNYKIPNDKITKQELAKIRKMIKKEYITNNPSC